MSASASLARAHRWRIFEPVLWIAAFAMDDVFAASFGCVWLLGRILYARGYYRKAKGRQKGFVISMLMNFVLFAGAIAGVVASF